MLLIVAAGALLSFFFVALFITLGARWAKVPASQAGRGRIFAAAGLLSAGSFALAVAERIVGDAFELAPPALPAPETSAGLLPQILMLAVGLGVSVLLVVAVIRFLLKASTRQALKVAVTIIAGNLLLMPLVLFVVIPFLVEAFVNPGNAMAPTLLGQHCAVACPLCGGQAFCSPDPRGLDRAPDMEPTDVICGRCRRTSQVRDVPATVYAPDRFLVDKLGTPRRWDVVVFRFPEDPSIQYVSRLVGLPGERVAIRAGSVWINGRKQDRPKSLDGFEYTPYPGRTSPPPGGSSEESSPEWELGADEYFVLGDFSQRAKDSRTWSEGAPDHQPWAVPRSHLVGVATWTYWPPTRWRSLRPR